MAEHSKLPWSVRNDECTKIQDSDGHMLATFSYVHIHGRRDPDEVQANATFIVKAVNSHAANEAKIEALTSALEGMVLVCGRTGDAFHDFEEQAEAFYQDTRLMRPGKSVPMEMARDDEDERRAEYSKWVKAKLDAGRAALTSAGEK